ncbi:MAG: alanine dehydrogenase [Gammaproteobacteria bacterium]|nr:alanine dehydrogenase [Gammaproteobacteria bacterium]
MKIGVPKELKTLEGRVALTPAGCAELIEQGHELVIEQSAGLLSGYEDHEYAAEGCRIAQAAESLYAESELIVKVKEPVEGDLKYLSSRHILFSFLHLAANKALVQRLLASGCTAIAFESVVNEQNQRPILAVMSQIAGRLAVQIGAHLLHQPMGGNGVLLGGVDHSDNGHVLVIGAGRAGEAAVLLADKIGADVSVFDIDVLKLARLKKLGNRISTQVYDPVLVGKQIQSADLVVGAVLLADKHAPKVVTEEMVKTMKKGAVIIDIAIDQGGCVETMKATTYESPTYVEHGVIHFGVTNMPGAVPRTASQVLSAAILPSVIKIASLGGLDDKVIKKAINIQSGAIIHPALIDEFRENRQ